MNADPAPLLWLCGPPCVGKSAVGWEIFAQVRRAGVKAAYVDLSQVGFCRPALDDDADNHRLKALNLGVMWPTFRSTGARCLIISGGVVDRDAVRMYADAVPGTVLTLCRLRAGRNQLTERILLRGRGVGPAIPGDELKGQHTDNLYRFAEGAARVADELDGAELGDLCVDTDGRSVEDVAHLVRAMAGGWPELSWHGGDELPGITTMPPALPQIPLPGTSLAFPLRTNTLEPHFPKRSHGPDLNPCAPVQPNSSICA